MKLILLLLVLLTGAGVWETVRHRVVRRRIPVRVHVNGSRGKSSVTRLIAAGLQAGGVRTCAKTTGSAAMFLHVDGSESPIRRQGPPNIREQLRVFRQAAQERAEAIVIECMAVRPDLQRVCEHSIVGATHGVITNVRPDHLEVMGPSMEDVATSLAGTVPRGTALFTAEGTFAPRLERRARRLGSSFHRTDGSGVDDAAMAGFRYVEFPDNVDLALDVCQAVGVDRATALRGMWDVTPDVGALSRVALPAPGKTLEFVNAFAANDPESTLAVWRRLGLDARPEEAVVLFNNRADRLRRARDLAPIFGDGGLAAAKVVICGQATAQFVDLVRRRVPRDRLVDAGSRDAEALRDLLVEVCPERATVVGVGNIGGVGMRFLDLLERGRTS
ncbi:poly-gamma-glutamate synthase PgsB [bacterium]|nr:poly-gamma-glutamate synthase PgsB [bacterium]HPF34479.1 poly-gamma-glutamate synthase PgsB [Candidatus Krumholzibacteria bacterium]HRX49744.1 poly-gamma-glutamate synthase PgsB [Candidatus Krumholzibacteria bacterium]